MPHPVLDKPKDQHEREYITAKRGTMPDDVLAENVRQYRAITASDRRAALEDVADLEEPPALVQAPPRPTVMPVLRTEPPAPMSAAQRRMDRLRKAGFAEEEIQAWELDKRQALSTAGFSQGEIDTYFGHPPFEKRSLVAHITANLEEATTAVTESGVTQPIKDFSEAFMAGLGFSSTALLVKGRPTEDLPTDPSRAARIGAQVGGLAGDLPTMVVGAAVGARGGPISALAGAFALPAGIRKIMMDKYDKGEVTDFATFWDHLSGALIDTAKGYITGLATGAVGKAIGLAPIVSPTAKALTQTAGEITTMVTVGKALEGQVPEPNDFVDTAITLGFVKGATKMAGKLRTIYAETGVKPADLAADAQKDPTILQDLASENVEIPKAYKGKGTKEPAAPVKPIPTQEPVGKAQQAILDRIVQEERKPEGHTLSDIYTSVLDNLNPIKQALKAGGKGELPTGQNPYDLERLTRGTMGKGNQFIKHGAFDFNSYENVTRGYQEILEPVKHDLDGFRAYMVAKRAIEKEGQGIKTGIPLDDAKQVVKEGKAKYEKVHQERIAYRNALLQYLEDSGIVSSQAAAAMREANKDYVPFYRFFEEERESKGKGGGGSPIKRMKGSERQILDPIVSDVKDTFLFIALAEKNAARQAYVKLGPEFAEKQKQPMRTTHLKEEEIQKLFDEFLTVRKETAKSQTETSTTTGGPEGAKPTTKQTQLIVARVREALVARGFQPGEADQMMKRVGEAESGKVGATVEKVIKEIETTTYIPEMDIRLPNEAAVIFRALQAPLKKDEIAVFTKGHRDVYKVDPKVAEAFEDLDRVSTNMVAKALLHTPASLLRAGVTITPDFISRNILRDSLTAFIYAGSHPIKTLKGAYSLVTEDTAFQKWLKGGGANATMVALDRDYIQKHLVDLNTQTGLMQRAWNVGKTPLDLLRAASEFAENSTRLGAVRSELLQAKDKASIQALALLSREATVDFARHGRDIQEAAKMTAFLNPTLQGIDRFAREMKANPYGTTAKALAAITLPSVLLWWANKDDKEIQDLPDWQKNLFWIARIPLPNGGSFLFRYPKPQEIGILFATLPERILDAWVLENPHALEEIGASMLQTFTPNMVPTVLAPMISQFANMDTFLGRPLIPTGMEGLLPEYQYTEYTTETAKALGQLIGAFPGMEKAALRSDQPFIGGTARALTTPILMENYIRAWTGGMGMYLFQLADTALRKTGVVPDPVLPASTLADIPFVKAFVVRYPSASAQSIQDFYNDVTVSKRYYDTIMALAKTGDQRALKLIQEHGSDMAQLTGVRETLSEHSKIIRLIYKNPDIPPEEKRQLIDTLYFRMIELARAGNAALREIEKTTQHRD